MVIELIRKIREVGAIPFLRLGHAKLSAEMIRGGTEEQFETMAKHQMEEMKDMDAYIAIRGGDNAFESSDVPVQDLELSMKLLSPVIKQRVNKTRWCGLRWPSNGLAQQSGLSTEKFEDFYFDVCLMNYGELLPAMKHLAEMMNDADQVEIKDKDTHLTFSIKDMPAIPCAGEYNIPDGEVFTAPLKESVNGYITYNCPKIGRAHV